ncbi:MAG: DUF4105 domain-containing protein [Rubritalea sp.]|uniref:lipoprotein N-acyltransferase Lnb domain-containing protein n=1 Tax=Rubritalea sp. TaxID=2109375 RepID=UPI00324275ED
MSESSFDWQKLLPKILRFIGNTGLILFVLYWWGAVFYDGPFGQASLWNALLAIAWVVALVLVWLKFEQRWNKVLSVFALSLLVIVPWSFIQPNNDKNWAQDFEKTGHVTIEGDLVTFHNFRDFDYTKAGVVTPTWTTRQVHLSKLKGMDIFHDRFLGNLMAHPILSFDFGDDGHICLSIETRKEEGEKFTPVGGLYKVFELQYIFSSEEDVVRVRTNIRKEPVFLYKSAIKLDEIRELFLSSVEVQNELLGKPQFYNIINANCTTSIRNQIPKERQSAFDVRMLVNGLLDQYLYEKGSIVTDGLRYNELRDRCQIDKAAQAAHDDPEFSKRVREGRPGQ